MSLYLTAILPPAHLSEEIDDLRKDLSARFNVHAALKPPVHITLFRPVSLAAEMEEHLLKLLKPVQYSNAPFTQDLQNFDSFNNKTLFIHCVKNPLLQGLQKEISEVFYRNNVDRREEKGKAFHPHITIAYRDVQPKVFRLLWEEFKDRKLKRSFTIDRFSLLKHDGKRWNLLADFPLLKTEELTLFT